ncbi:MAG: EamA family transporter, partial [Bacteroidota bacterium]|nr:EamA family transporter [Bacteroidota bacterium]
DVPPFMFSGIRQIVAGSLLVLFFYFKGRKLPSKKDLISFSISGALMIGVGNGLVAWAEVHVSSGLAAIICSLVPIWIILFNLVGHRAEKINGLIIIGMLLGIIGLLLIFNDNLADFTNPAYTWGIVAIFIANAGWALGTVITKKFKTDVDPINASGWQIFLGGLCLGTVSLLSEDLSQANFTIEATFALVYLIFFGSILAFGCYIYALSKLPAGLVAIYAYVNPVVAVLLGWLVLGEKINLTVVLACGIILLGIFMVNQGYKTTGNYFWSKYVKELPTRKKKPYFEKH